MPRVLLLAFIWGWSFLFIKVAVKGMTPATVASVRIMLGFAVLLAVLTIRRIPLPRDRTSWRHFSVLALTYTFLPFTLFAWGVQRITSALASVLNASTVLFTAVFIALLLGERLTRVQWAGVGLGFVGVAVAAGVGGSDLAGSSITGTAACVVATSMYGLGFTYTQHHGLAAGGLVTATGQMAVASALSAPVALVSTLRDGIELTPTRVLAMVLLGCLGTGYAWLLSFRAISELGSTRASLVTYIVPVVAVAVGVTVLDEPFQLRLVVGAALIVLGILAVQERLGWLRLRRLPAGAAGGGPVVLVVVLSAALILGACGSDEEPAANATTTSTTSDTLGCGSGVEEQLDPQSGRHLLPGATEPPYISDPPTSGAHAAGPAPTGGVLINPLARPQQVQRLEQGQVIIQHQGISASARATLESLAGAKVTVAPGSSLPAPVVATAWLHKQLCETVHLESLRAFIAAHEGRGPGH